MILHLYELLQDADLGPFLKDDFVSYVPESLSNEICLLSLMYDFDLLLLLINIHDKRIISGDIVVVAMLCWDTGCNMLVKSCLSISVLNSCIIFNSISLIIVTNYV